MALGSRQIHSPWLTLYFAGLQLISAGRTCDGRRLLSTESEKQHHKLDSNVIIEVVILAGVTLLVALACLLRQYYSCCGSRVGDAAEEEQAAEDDPKSIPPTMQRSPCDSPGPKHWKRRHVSPVRHHCSPRSEPSPSGQQNSAAAVNSCLRDIAPVCQGPLKEFRYLSLAKATKDFKKGNQYRSGVLYAGHLLFDDGLVRPVAIKRFHITITDSEQIREDLRRKKYMLQHRNLVTLFGYCLHEGKLYLVYDWMRDHSLDYELFAEKDCNHPALTLVQRKIIIKDAARGLLQLHATDAFHGAVKASNIMLEPTSSGFRARLADFRYSPLLTEHEGSEPAKGTLGSLLYPESILSVAADNSGGAHGPSLERDVLHFGGMMLEVLCGRRLFACDQLPAGYSSLLDWVQELNGEARLEALDENAKRDPDFDKAQADLLFQLSLRCTNPNPRNRPTIETVLTKLSNTTPE